MPQDISPRVVLNEDYLDLRSQSKKSRGLNEKNSIRKKLNVKGTINSQTTQGFGNLNNNVFRYEKQLINSGLKKLASSYNANKQECQSTEVNTRRKNKLRGRIDNDSRFRKVVVVPQKANELKTHSDHSLLPKDPNIKIHCATPNSSPLISKERTTEIEYEEPSVVSKYVTAKPDDVIEGWIITPTKRSRSQSKSRSKLKYFLKPPDSRLREKYSLLKMPWQKSWTLPTFALRSTTALNCRPNDNSDRQTYLYDEGTEINSLYLDEVVPNTYGKTLQRYCAFMLILCGGICGILLVSLLIWFIFGNNYLIWFFKPRRVEEGLISKLFMFVGGTLVFCVTRLFETLGYILALPTQKIYQSEPEYYRWPINAI